jgi:predicted DNA-binding antitoxin AbrB/MazE fold protein
MTIAAKYEEGVFKPLEDVAIKEGTVAEVCCLRAPTA